MIATRAVIGTAPALRGGASSMPRDQRRTAVGGTAALCVLLALCACGGGASESAKPTLHALPPANPVAAQKFLEASALLGANKSGDYARAESLLREAIALDAYLWEAHYNLGVLLRRRGELRAAQQELQAAHNTQPAAGEPLLALAEVQDALGKHQASVDLLEEYVKGRPNAADVRIALTALLREQGQYDGAMEQARAVLVRDPKSSGALLEVGRIYRARGELDVAELVFNRALHLDEKSPHPHNELGLTALARGDTQVAFERFEDALKADRGFAPARLNRASVLLRAGDYTGAASEYRKVLEQDESHDQARVGLAIALRGQQKHKEAAAEYERVLAHSPNQAAALFDLGVLRVEFLDKRAEARELFERFLAVAPEGEARTAAERYVDELGHDGDSGKADAPQQTSGEPSP